MKYSILTFALAVGLTAPAGFAQVQSSTTAQHNEEHSSTQVSPDGTAVEHKSATSDNSETSKNADGSTRTVTSKETERKTKMKKDAPLTNDSVGPDGTSSTVKHSNSSTTTTETTVKP